MYESAVFCRFQQGLWRLASILFIHIWVGCRRTLGATGLCPLITSFPDWRFRDLSSACNATEGYLPGNRARLHHCPFMLACLFILSNLLPLFAFFLTCYSIEKGINSTGVTRRQEFYFAKMISDIWSLHGLCKSLKSFLFRLLRHSALFSPRQRQIAAVLYRF